MCHVTESTCSIFCVFIKTNFGEIDLELQSLQFSKFYSQHPSNTHSYIRRYLTYCYVSSFSLIYIFLGLILNAASQFLWSNCSWVFKIRCFHTLQRVRKTRGVAVAGWQRWPTLLLKCDSHPVGPHVMCWQGSYLIDKHKAVLIL